MNVLATTAVALALAGVPALAGEAPRPEAAAPSVDAAAPSASDLLFEEPQMKNAAPGSTLTYAYLRRSGIAKGPFGAPLQDTIALKVEPGKRAEGRDISVRMFSGMNRVPAGPFEDMTGNPVVALFLENHLNLLARVLEGNPRYLKLAIRKGLRERATVTPATLSVAGREVDGWRIVTRPFVGDPRSDRMRGMDGMTYTFLVSPAVPGEIVSMEASARTAEGGELLEETLGYDPKAG